MNFEIASWIRERRKARGWSQAILAEKIGVSQPVASLWETGKVVPPPQVIKKLVQLLGPFPVSSHRSNSSTSHSSTSNPLPESIPAKSGSINSQSVSTPGPLEQLPRPFFVQARDLLDGVGKLIAANESEGLVEYFISPAGPELRQVTHSLSQLRQVELSNQTRVYWFDPDQSAWRSGRTDGMVSVEALRASRVQANEDVYLVRFPNHERDRKPISSLFVRWAHPIEDPTAYLGARITDTPLFYDGRSQFLKYLSLQRAGFGGLTGAASAAIELLEHQVTAVRKVLRDPIERYLLADEVGLGKTVEAGILVRQHIIDYPHTARILIAVPPHLIAQWRRELTIKFFLPDSDHVTIVPHNKLLGQELGSETWTMLVVDEAQRIALEAFHPLSQRRESYAVLACLARRTPRLLLLSGTPVLHQEDGFLAMLHLLDPEGYPLEDRDAFRHRVRERQAIAQTSLDLADDASAIFAEEAIARVVGLFASDQQLQILCEEAKTLLDRPIEDEGRMRALRRLRLHLSETYKLHRRLLRTRRDDVRVRFLLPNREGVTAITYEDPEREEAFDLLETWRIKATLNGEPDQNIVHLFAELIERALFDPRALLHSLETRLGYLQFPRVVSPAHNILSTESAFHGEKEFLSERCGLLRSLGAVDSRTEKLTEWLQQNPNSGKYVVFVSAIEVAERVASTLKSALGQLTVMRHQVAVQNRDEEIAFLTNPKIRVLVCDQRAEEGLNLQTVRATIVHFDLPLDAPRIEQRIGRLDRIEARGNLRNIVFSSRSSYEAEWLRCLEDPIQIFKRSVAPLQYALLDSRSRILERLLTHGSTVISEERLQMADPKAGLDAELRRIREQESLDSLEGDPDSDHRFFEALKEADERVEDTGHVAFDNWVVKCLRFQRRRDDTVGFRYAHNAENPTLVPLFEAMNRLGSCVEKNPSARHGKHDVPFQKTTFSRSESERATIPLLRVGHPFVDGMEALIRGDDRGAAFAMWRHCPSVEATRLFLQFDFSIQADLSQAQSVLASIQASPEALRRRADDAFPVHYYQVWLDSDLDEIRDPELIQLLQIPYAKHSRSGIGRDWNLRLDRWGAADRLFPISDWPGLCRRACTRAETILRTDPEFQARCTLHFQRACDLASAAEAEFQARIARLSGAARRSEESLARFEQRLSEALAAGIQNPTVRVESVGAIYLSPVALEE